MSPFTRSLALLLTCSITMAPAFAANYEELVNQRDQLVNQANQTLVSDDVLHTIESLTVQINQLDQQRRAADAAQKAQLKANQERIAAQRAAVNAALYGQQTTGSNSVPLNSVPSQVSSVPYVPGQQVPNMVNPPVQDSRIANTALPAPKSGTLTGGVTNIAPMDRVNSAVEAALKDSPNLKAIQHYSTKMQQAIATGKDALNYMVPYRGFGPSSDAGDLVLNERPKVKSLAAALFSYQKQYDELHLKVTQLTLRLAQQLGANTPTSGTIVELSLLVPPDDAVKIVNSVFDLKNAPKEVSKIDADLAAKQSRYEALVAKAIDKDPVIKSIVDEIHKRYNRHGKVAMTASHVIPVLLSVVRLAPTVAGPVAAASLVTWVMSTGGSEDSKLMKILYMDKRISTRLQLICEESHALVDAQQLGSITGNDVLQATAEQIMQGQK